MKRPQITLYSAANKRRRACRRRHRSRSRDDGESPTDAGTQYIARDSEKSEKEKEKQRNQSLERVGGGEREKETKFCVSKFISYVHRRDRELLRISRSPISLTYTYLTRYTSKLFLFFVFVRIVAVCLCKMCQNHLFEVVWFLPYRTNDEKKN